jgi:hypothetical protein
LHDDREARETRKVTACRPGSEVFLGNVAQNVDAYGLLSNDLLQARILLLQIPQALTRKGP